MRCAEAGPPKAESIFSAQECTYENVPVSLEEKQIPETFSANSKQPVCDNTLIRLMLVIGENPVSELSLLMRKQTGIG